VELIVTCLVCGQDVDLARQLELASDAPFGCPYCDPEVAEAIGMHFPLTGDTPGEAPAPVRVGSPSRSTLSPRQRPAAAPAARPVP